MKDWKKIMMFFGKSILWGILCFSSLYAEVLVQTTLKSNSVFEGESATLTIRVKGEKVVLPNSLGCSISLE